MARRAQTAVYLYGRSHTHELGLCIAAAGEDSTLRRVAGLIGNLVYEQSRQPCPRPGDGDARFGGTKPKISLGRSRANAA